MHRVFCHATSLEESVVRREHSHEENDKGCVVQILNGIRPKNGIASIFNEDSKNRSLEEEDDDTADCRNHEHPH